MTVDNEPCDACPDEQATTRVELIPTGDTMHFCTMHANRLATNYTGRYRCDYNA